MAAGAELDGWLQYVNTVLLSLLTIAGRFVYGAVSEVKKKLEDMDLRITKFEEFRSGHEKWCTERNARNDREHGEIHEAIETSRKSVHEMRNEIFQLLLRSERKKEGL